ncbi:MAG: tRNA-dihydrouridine synthase, partial [Terrimicrobiaceae bacterium]|nr:tRNA-dihydrouridine synthase [Terrimicrobiaceae bacterium]
HGRTRAQGYSGEADWGVIGEVAAAVAIPVIGNGDIRCGADAVRRRAECGVAGLMVGRAAMCAPWIFGELRAALEGQAFTPPSMAGRWELILRHCREEILWRGAELPAMRAMRARLMAYTRGMPGGARLRELLARVERFEDAARIAREAQGIRPARSAAMPSAILEASF